MKTFSEAFDACVITTDRRANPEVVASAIEAAYAKAEKAADLEHEIAEHDNLILVLTSIYTASCCQYHASLRMFMLGLRIGMLMEASETGGVLPTKEI